MSFFSSSVPQLIAEISVELDILENSLLYMKTFLCKITQMLLSGSHVPTTAPSKQSRACIHLAEAKCL